MMDWPASQVTMRPITDLTEAAANSRLHTPEQVSQIAASIKEFGWTIPVLVDEHGVLIAGHARVRAGLELGITEVPVMVAEGWSDAKKEAYQIADNRLAENSTWDQDILTAQFKRIASVDFNMDVLGFDWDELDLNAGFDPNLAPTTGKTNVTGDDITKTKQNLEGQFSVGGTVKQSYEVTCPHCGSDFEVEL